MNRKDFLIILEQINTTQIKEDLFTFKFSKDSNTNIIICEFNVNDLKDRLTLVKIQIDSDDKFKFFIQNKDKKQQINQEKFMALYNTEYNKFKEAYKKYKKQQIDQKYILKHKNKEKQQSTSDVPKINQFNDVINKQTQNDEVIQVKQKYLTFNFKKHQNEEYTNLYLCKFEVENKETDEELDLPSKFLVTTIIKVVNQNAIIIKFIFVNPFDKEQSFEISVNDFIDDYQKEYKLLQNALKTFKTILKRKQKKLPN